MNSYKLDLLFRGELTVDSAINALEAASNRHGWRLEKPRRRPFELRDSRASPTEQTVRGTPIETDKASGWVTFPRPSVNRSDFGWIGDEEWLSVSEFPEVRSLLAIHRTASAAALSSNPPALDLMCVSFSTQPRPYFMPDEVLIRPMVNGALLDGMKDVGELVFAQGYLEGFEFDTPFGIDLGERLDENLSTYGYLASGLVSTQMAASLEKLERWMRRRLESLSSYQADYPWLFEKYGVPLVRKSSDGVSFYCDPDPASKILGFWLKDVPGFARTRIL